MKVKIEKIIVDMGFNLRGELDKQLISEYQETLDVMPPVTIYDTERGYILVDGFHRLAAAKQKELDEINADIKQGSVQDALAFACIANLKHGKQLTSQERQNAIRQYIKLNVGKSNRLIAEDVGCDEKTIRIYRSRMEDDGEIETQKKRVGKDDRVIDKVTAEFSAVEPEPEPEIDPYDEWFDNHVLHGDTFELLQPINRKFDLAIVDPPYGVTKEKWDNIDRLTFTRRWIQIVLSKLKSTGRLYVFYSREYMFELKPLVEEIKHEYPLHFGGMIIWNFRNVGSMPDNRKQYKLTYEPLFYFYGLDAGKLHLPSDTYGTDKSDIIGDAQMDVWVEAIPQSNFVQDKHVHPTQKPVALYKRIIETGSNPGDIVLDPFAGSGTTGQAALELGRDIILMEQELDYVEKIRMRLQSVWGKTIGTTK